MRKSIFGRISALIGVCIVALTVSNGQTSGVNRVEFFGGFSHNRIAAPYNDEDLGFLDDDLGTGTSFRETFGGRYGSNGVNFSITGNPTKYFGLKFDVSTHSSSQSLTVDGITLEQKYRLTNYLGGIQIKNNAKDGPRVKPFFHAMAGVANQKVKLQGTGADFLFGEQVDESETNFALAIGGGLDIKVHKRVDLRVFQVDYNPTYVKDREGDFFELEGRYQPNIRFGFGIVIH